MGQISKSILKQRFIGLFLCAAVTQVSGAPLPNEVRDKCLEKAGEWNNGVLQDCAVLAIEKANQELSTLRTLIFKKMTDTDARKKFDQYLSKNSAAIEGFCSLSGWYIGSPMDGICTVNLKEEQIKTLRFFYEEMSSD
jgi:hypothetical protein